MNPPSAVGKSSRKASSHRGVRAPTAAPAVVGVEAAFAEVVGLIHAARQRTAQAVNTELIDLYWRIGQFLHLRIEADGWAQGTVVQLAAYVARREPGQRGFSAQSFSRAAICCSRVRDITTSLRNVEGEGKLGAGNL